MANFVCFDYFHKNRRFFDASTPSITFSEPVYSILPVQDLFGQDLSFFNRTYFKLAGGIPQTIKILIELVQSNILRRLSVVNCKFALHNQGTVSCYRYSPGRIFPCSTPTIDIGPTNPVSCYRCSHGRILLLLYPNN